MPAGESHVNERLDHLIMAGSERWIGLAAWLDEQDPTNQKPSERRDGKEARMKCPHCEQVWAEKGAWPSRRKRKIWIFYGKLNASLLV